MAPPPGALTLVLGEIWASGLPLAERRRLCARASTAVLLGASPSDEREEAPDARCELHHFEDALRAAALLVGGRERLSISEAKAALRQQGLTGRRLASRLGRQSKLRNSRAHPDVGLVRDIEALAERASSSGRAEPSGLSDGTTADEFGADRAPATLLLEQQQQQQQEAHVKMETDVGFEDARLEWHSLPRRSSDVSSGASGDWGVIGCSHGTATCQQRGAVGSDGSSNGSSHASLDDEEEAIEEECDGSSSADLDDEEDAIEEEMKQLRGRAGGGVLYTQDPRYAGLQRRLRAVWRAQEANARSAR